MPSGSGYPSMPPHLAAHGAKQNEWRSFLDLLARHQALAEEKRSLLPLAQRQPLPPSSTAPAALSLHEAAAWPR